MKALFLIFFSFFFLYSCGNSSSPNDISFRNSGVNTATGSGFSMPVPKDWTLSGAVIPLADGLKSRQLLSSISPEKKYNFSENIVVIEQDLNLIGSSKQYSEHNHNTKKSAYQNYSLIEAGQILFRDADDSVFYVFDAKYNNNTPKMRFIQTAKFCGTKLYFLHATAHLGSKGEEFLKLFRGFECKKEK